ncbi:4-amino-4-deoxy-L-arabinose transferase [Curtobacterium sp. 'Ferrero']|uniref:ArnT family glycosyltransferase n=1 Tax=Curtobacterium sp. 'Ferrero' TaxID=2033654 RepID=UPI000BC88293|nr:glycosyltransferase family 39 protein [Curtobacterium sp. 'Ferrero']PCN48659.1 4-amino-4-deoxy-L-arabinose transferase [Curtobacterium sp. 'Ferrero']
MSTSEHARVRPARWLHQSRPELAVLVGIVVLGAALTSWNLARGGDSEFYAAAARSMSESWSAFLSGSFDPGSTVTLDKLAGFAVPQAVSVHLFGMSTAALALPQVLEGAVTTVAVSVVGLRWAGARVGLVAGGLAAATPIFVSMFGHPMEDGLLTMALAVAFVWWQRAAITGAWWPLLLAGLFVGVGFQAKMLQAWLVLPALVVGTVIAAAVPGVRRRRVVWHVAVLVGSAVVASLAWSVVVELLPRGDRPFIDGSTDDDVFAMVFGYNGVDRFLPGLWPGAVGALGNAVAHAGRAFTGGGHGAAGHTLLQLFTPRYASQVGWSWPAALVGIGIGAARWWPRPTRREARPAFATLVTTVVWLVTAVAVLSVMRLPHTAYVAGVGVQLAVLAAIGWWGAARCVDAPDRRLRVVPVGLLVVQGAWWAWLARTSSEPVLLGVVAVGTTIAAVIALLVHWGGASVRPTGRGRRLAAGLLAASVVLGPACFSLQALDAARDGSGGDASVGVGNGAFAFGGHSPARAFALGRSGTLGADRTVVPSSAFRISAPDPWGGHTALPTSEAALVDTAERDGGGQGGAPLFLSDSWRISADVIGDTGREVLTDGGFSGHVPVFTEQQVERLVRSGRVRLLVVTASPAGSDPVLQAADALGCRVVRSWGAGTTAARHGGSDGSGGSGGGFGGFGGFGGAQAFSLERCD